MDLPSFSGFIPQTKAEPEPDEDPLPLPEDSEAWDAIFEEVGGEA
jgi:hypothetical protein